MYQVRGDAHVVAKAGWPFIVGPVLFGLGLCLWSPWAALPFFLFAGFSVYFFRNPERLSTASVDAVISPADGRILSIEDVHDARYLNRACRRVCIFMSPFNVHVNRMPMSGKVSRVVYTAGKKLAAFADKASLLNEQNAVLLECENGDTIAFVQIAGFLARRIVCDARRGDVYDRGERYGLIRFGSRVDLYLPLHAKVLVAVGDRVASGETVLARFG